MEDLTKALLVGWLMKLQSDPTGAIENCRAHYRRSEITENRRKHQVVAFIVGFVQRLAGSEEEQQGFLDHEFWPKGGHKPRADKLAILACRFILGAKKTRGALYQQALSWSKVVEFYIQHQTEPEAVIDHLGEYKLHRVIDQVEKEVDCGGEMQSTDGSPSTKPKTFRAQPGERVDEVLDGPSPGNESHDTDSDETPDGPTDEEVAENGRMLTSVRRKQKRTRDPSFDRNLHIYFEAGVFMRDILDTPAGSDVQITLRRVIWPSPWKRFEAIRVQPVSCKLHE